MSLHNRLEKLERGTAKQNPAVVVRVQEYGETNADLERRYGAVPDGALVVVVRRFSPKLNRAA